LHWKFRQLSIGKQKWYDDLHYGASRYFLFSWQPKASNAEVRLALHFTPFNLFPFSSAEIWHSHALPLRRGINFFHILERNSKISSKFAIAYFPMKGKIPAIDWTI